MNQMTDSELLALRRQLERMQDHGIVLLQQAISEAGFTLAIILDEMIGEMGKKKEKA